MAEPLMSMAQQATSAPDGMTAIYLLVGAFVVKELLSFGRDFIKGLAARTVAREDKDKETFQKQLDELKEKLEEVEESISDMDRSVLDTKNDVKAIGGTVESIRGSLTNLGENVDKRIEKQGQHYREEQAKTLSQVNDALEKLEFSLRQDTSRAIHDANLMATTRKKKL